jgi:heptose I phosphotransferase
LSASPIIILDEPFLSLWSDQDPFSAVEALPGKVVRAMDGRRTFRTEVAGQGYYVKIHRGVGWQEIFKNLLSGRLPIVGAANEWRATRRLAELGVDSLYAVAFGQRGNNPARQHSFVITRELAPVISLENYTRRWKREPPSFALKRALIERIAAMARRMHAGGVNHRDLYICHFLLHLDPPPEPGKLRLSLVDLHRAQIRPRVPVRWRNKDLAALHFSSLGIGLTQRDRLRFLRHYFGDPLREILRQESALLAFLQSEGLRLQERFRRKFAPASDA